MRQSLFGDGKLGGGQIEKLVNLLLQSVLHLVTVQSFLNVADKNHKPLGFIVGKCLTSTARNGIIPEVGQSLYPASNDAKEASCKCAGITMYPYCENNNLPSVLRLRPFTHQ